MDAVTRGFGVRLTFVGTLAESAAQNIISVAPTIMVDAKGGHSHDFDYELP